MSLIDDLVKNVQNHSPATLVEIISHLSPHLSGAVHLFEQAEQAAAMSGPERKAAAVAYVEGLIDGILEKKGWTWAAPEVHAFLPLGIEIAVKAFHLEGVFT